MYIGYMIVIINNQIRWYADCSSPVHRLFWRWKAVLGFSSICVQCHHCCVLLITSTKHNKAYQVMTVSGDWYWYGIQIWLDLIFTNSSTRSRCSSPSHLLWSINTLCFCSVWDNHVMDEVPLHHRECWKVRCSCIIVIARLLQYSIDSLVFRPLRKK